MDTDQQGFLKTSVPKLMLVANIVLALFYFIAITFFFERGNTVLFWLLIFGEVFHVWQVLTFIHTIWDTEYVAPRDLGFTPPVNVFITVAGEPAEIVEETVRAALRMDYPNFKVYVLNDGYVAKKENWEEIEKLAIRLGAFCITRLVPGGAKAGNINHALSFTANPFVAIFDADHVPARNFLKETMPYFVDPKLAYVQTPQFYKNHELNSVTGGAWEQQTLFYGPICKGRNRLNSVAMCGTNMVIRRTALDDVGGMREESITEDFLTGFLMHKRGWRSLYVPRVLASGRAPEDFLSYAKQQSRWARGGLDLLFRHNLLFARGLTFSQRVQYLSSLTFFLSGWIVLVDALFPIIFFFTGLFPIKSSTMALAAIFLPYIFITLYTIQRSCNFSFTFRSLAFSMSGFNLQIKSSLAAFFHHNTKFAITSKYAVSGNFAKFVVPQIIYLMLVAGGVSYAVVRGGVTPSLITNFAWALLNAVIFGEFIKAALPNRKAVPLEVVQNESLSPWERIEIPRR